MSSLAGSRQRFAEVVRREPIDIVTALLLISAEAGFDPDPVPVLAELDRLAVLARIYLDAGMTPAGAIEIAMTAEGFLGSATAYELLGSSLLPEVLRRRSGLPILMSVVWVEVARRLDVPAHCLGAPGHVLASIGGEVVDPFDGGTAVIGAARDIPVLAGGSLLLRVLANIRALAAKTGDSALSLWSVELSLLLPSHPVELRRELGLLLVRRGAFLEGARELEAFASVVPSPHDEEAQRAAKMARARLN